MGYFTNASRVDAFTKCAQFITLRTRLMPQVFEGDPTEVNIGTKYVTRTVRWGNDVFAMANFSPTDNMTLNLPSGTWYDYYAGGTSASGTITLQAGELKIFTGKKVELPVINKDLESLLPVENVSGEETQKAQKIMRNGQVLILRGDKVYTITGM
jgi:hypothetical protein